MVKLNKILACILSFSLLGQSAVLAAPSAAASQEPKSLAEYQARAKEEIKKTPWIKREGKYVLGLGGAVTAGFIVREVVHQRNGKKQAAALRELETAQSELAAAQKELSDLQEIQSAIENDRRVREAAVKYDEAQEHFGATHRTLRENGAKHREFLRDTRETSSRIKKEIRDLEKHLSSQEVAKSMEAKSARIQALERELLEKKKIYQLRKERYEFLTSYLGGNMDAYAKLFDASVPEVERKALLKQLSNESWLRQATQAQQKEFLQIVELASQKSVTAGKQSADVYMHSLVRTFLDLELPLYERLMALCGRVFRSKNLLVVGLVVGLGLSAQNASAQKMADRVNKNFDLFLNATPQELAEMEKDEEVVKVCVQGAEVLHQMSQLDEEEQNILSEEWQTSSQHKPAMASRAQLAR